MTYQLHLGLFAAFALCLSGLFSSPQLGQAHAARYSFRRHIYPMFKRYCVKCHRSVYKWKRVKIKGKRKRIKVLKKKPAGKLDLSSRKLAYKNIYDVQSKQANEGYNIVTPKEVVRSYLVYKLLGQHKQPNLGGKGKRCPPKRKLSSWKIRRIIKWIKQGAKK